MTSLVLSVSNGEIKLIFSYNLLSRLLSLCTLNSLWLPGCTTRMEPCFLSMSSAYCDK